MKEEYFVNVAFEEAIKLYLAYSNDKSSITYNTAFVVVIRLLVLIYGKLEIINPYYLKDNVAFMNTLGKYGISNSQVALFKDEFLRFYLFEQDNGKKPIKNKNPYFSNIQKCLVDMFVAKKSKECVSIVEEEKFLDLIYSSHTRNYYRLSYAYLMCDDIKFIEKYYYSKLNKLDVTRELALDKTIVNDLNLEALNLLGIDLTILKNMSNEEIHQAQARAYQYFEIDAESPNRDRDLREALNYYKMYGKKKLTSGNGYVDILLLMSVIVTAVSIILIVYFSIR